MNKCIRHTIATGILLCIMTINTSMAITVPRILCSELGLTIGARCDLQGNTGVANAEYYTLCRGTNSACKWRQCYNTCVCTDDFSYDCCSGQADAVGATLWKHDAYHIYSKATFLDNTYQDRCDHETKYACEHGYYGSPTNNAFASQCKQCPENGDSHGPGEHQLSWPTITISNDVITDCFISGGSDEIGTYVFEPICYYNP